MLGALGQCDLANYQVSPYAYTLPKLLNQRDYESAIFGKFHIGLQQNNPFEFAVVGALGWDCFLGWLDKTGDSSSIDSLAGLSDAFEGHYLCGFVPSEDHDSVFGADEGTCYSADG